MQIAKPVDPFKAGEELSASRMNGIAEPINALLKDVQKLTPENQRFYGPVVFEIAKPVPKWPGYYYGNRFEPMQAKPKGGGLVAADLGAYNDSQELLIVNLAEIKGSGHLLGKDYIGIGTPFNSYDGQPGNPSDGGGGDAPQDDPGDLQSMVYVLINVDCVSFDALLTSSTQANNADQWYYAFKEAYKSDAGYGKWLAMDNGRTGSQAYNRLEDINQGNGPTGVGIDSSKIPSGFSFKAIPNNTPVRMQAVINDKTGDIEYWFSAPNGIDGQCPPKSSSSVTAQQYDNY